MTFARRLPGSLGGLLLLGVAAVAWGQGRPLDEGLGVPQPLDEVVVTPDSSGVDVAMLDLEALLDGPVFAASKREQRASEAPLTVSAITADEFEGTGQFSLCGALQFFPGVDCRQGPMRKSVLSIRGLGSNFLSNRVLLLNDGRPETDPWTGVFYPDEAHPLVNVKRIEVIRGPGSSLYGTNAFSGVVNVVTRKPEDLIAPDRSWGTDLRLLAGQDSTYRAQATIAGKLGDLSGLVSYHGLTTAGPELLSDPARGVVDRQEWTRVNVVDGKVLYKFLTLKAGYSSSKIGRPGGKEFTTVGNCGRCHYTPSDSEAEQNFNANAQADIPVTDHVKVFAEAYLNLKRRTVEQLSAAAQELQTSLGKRRRVGGEVRVSFSGDSWNLTAGGDVKVDDVENTNIFPELSPADLRQSVFGVFADAELRFFERLILSGGLRYDHVVIPEVVWRNPSSELSPRGSAVFLLSPDISLRGSYGHAFRAPSLAELAINQQMYAATLLGNPELRAERLDAVELAVDVHPEDTGLRITGTGFVNFARDLINQSFLGGSTSQFQNIGSARVAGFEAEAEYRIPGTSTMFSAAYRFLDTQASTTEPLATGKLDYAAAHRVSLRGKTSYADFLFLDAFALFMSGRQDAGLQVDADGAPVGHVQLAPYLVSGLRVAVKPRPGFTASVLVSNLFNTQYQETFGFPAPGLRVFGELKFVY